MADAKLLRERLQWFFSLRVQEQVHTYVHSARYCISGSLDADAVGSFQSSDCLRYRWSAKPSSFRYGFFPYLNLNDNFVFAKNMDRIRTIIQIQHHKTFCPTSEGNNAGGNL